MGSEWERFATGVLQIDSINRLEEHVGSGETKRERGVSTSCRRDQYLSTHSSDGEDEHLFRGRENLCAMRLVYKQNT